MLSGSAFLITQVVNRRRGFKVCLSQRRVLIFPLDLMENLLSLGELDDVHGFSVGQVTIPRQQFIGSGIRCTSGIPSQKRTPDLIY